MEELTFFVRGSGPDWTIKCNEDSILVKRIFWLFPKFKKYIGKNFSTEEAANEDLKEIERKFLGVAFTVLPEELVEGREYAYLVEGPLVCVPVTFCKWRPKVENERFYYDFSIADGAGLRGFTLDSGELKKYIRAEGWPREE